MLVQGRYREKYLVVGSIKHLGEVESYSWNDPTLRALQIEDYHTFILHFDAIPSQLLQLENTTRVIQRKDREIKVLANVHDEILMNLNFLSEKLMQHRTKEKVAVFILISPINGFATNLFKQKLALDKQDADRLNLEYNNVSPENEGMKLVDLYFEFFSTFTFGMHEEQNISTINANEIVDPYFQEYTNFNFVFQVKNQHNPLALSFYNAELAFSQMHYEIDIIVLPHPKMISPFDTVELILRKIVKVEAEEHLLIPKWVDDYNTIRQMTLANEMTQLNLQIDAIKQQIKEKEAEFDLYRGFQRVLFTSGEIFRKSLVSLFSSLGVKTAEPGGNLTHDLEVESASHIFVVQSITLDSNILERSELRQLNQWVESKEERINFTKKVKGVAIVNYDIKNNPIKRETLTIDNAAENYIEKLGFCIMTTHHLFHLFNQVELGELGKFELLEKIAEQTGIFKM